MYRYVSRHMSIFLTSLDKYQGLQLLDYLVRVCLVLQENAKLSSKVISFCFLTSNAWEFCWSTSLQVFGGVSVPDCSHFNRCVGLPYRCFNLHFPDARDVRYLCIRLFAINIPFLVRCLNIFDSFSNQVFYFLIFDF